MSKTMANRANNRIPKLFQVSLYWPVLAIVKIFFHFKIEGQENLKGLEDGPIIFASNHNSLIDGGFAAASLPKNSFWPKNFFPIRFLGIDRFFGWRYFPINIIYKLSGVVKITRAKEKKSDNSHLYQVLAEPIKLLKNGSKIWIYPEGGFHKDGAPKRPRSGVIFLHQQTGAPIVPVRTIGNDKVMNKWLLFLPSFKSLIGLNKVKVVFGKPIYSLETSNLNEETNVLMDRINKLG